MAAGERRSIQGAITILHMMLLEPCQGGRECNNYFCIARKGQLDEALGLFEAMRTAAVYADNEEATMAYVEKFPYASLLFMSDLLSR